MAVWGNANDNFTKIFAAKGVLLDGLNNNHMI